MWPSVGRLSTPAIEHGSRKNIITKITLIPQLKNMLAEAFFCFK